ncbi:MAG: hypothetical protein ACPF8V_09225 [Luteibaculum sp.]
MKKFLFFLLALVVISACEKDGQESAAMVSNDGQGGSLATFVLKGEYLYVVDHMDLNVFSVKETGNPVFVNSVPVGFDIETLFGFQDYLYIGSRNGMFIYGLTNPEQPSYLGGASHFTACDPVVANETHAFVTLHSNVICGNDINVLEVYDIQNITSPRLIHSRNLIQPKGLGLYNDFLIVCDDEIKIFDVSNPVNLKLVNSISKSAFDVIILGDLLIAIGEAGLYQYQLIPTEEGLDYTELSTVQI